MGHIIYCNFSREKNDFHVPKQEKEFSLIHYFQNQPNITFYMTLMGEIWDTPSVGKQSLLSVQTYVSRERSLSWVPTWANRIKERISSVEPTPTQGEQLTFFAGVDLLYGALCTFHPYTFEDRYQPRLFQTIQLLAKEGDLGVVIYNNEFSQHLVGLVQKALKGTNHTLEELSN